MNAEKEQAQEKDNSFPEKYLKKLKTITGFTDGIDSADTEEIKKKILACEDQIFEIEQDKDNNPQILQAKEALKEMTGPYRETKSLETAKIKYMVHTLQSRGQQV